MRKSQLICAIASLAILALAANARAASTTGEIAEVGKNFLVVKVKKPAKSMKFRVSSNAQITLDGKKAALTQLKKGQQAAVTYSNDGKKFNATKIAATSAKTSLLPVAFVADEKPLRYSGKIKAVDKTTVSVMKAKAKKAWDFDVASDCAIKLDGKIASLNQLKVGQRAIVTYVKKDGKLHAKTITATST
jgi:hypothetical protein